MPRRIIDLFLTHTWPPLLVSGLLVLWCSIATWAQQRPIDYVNPNIGSVHSRWFFYTPAALPFGMAKLAPSTDGHLGSTHGWQANGYDDRHESIESFVHFHEFQVGGIAVMPTVGPLKVTPGELDKPDEGYRSRFAKADEIARPGYYRVRLKDYDVEVELTATQRVGFHRYTFPRSEAAHIIFDVGHQQGESGPVTDAYVRRVGPREIEGYVVTFPIYTKNYQPDARIRMYFVAHLNKAPKAVGAMNKGQVQPGISEARGPGAGLYLDFATEEREAIEMKVGLSYTSLANARLNFAAEATGKTFDQVRATAEATWNRELGKLRVEGGREEDRIKFYTGLYHALLGRGLASDVNGAYPKNDGTVGQILLKNGRPIHHHYNTDAVWGAFWNLGQLWALAWPEYYNDFIQSQLLVYQDAGWLGDGIANSCYVSGVGTNFVSLIFASAYTRGIRNFDVELAYEAALKNELEWRDRPAGAGKADLEHFVKHGYIPTLPDGSQFCASHTLEYCFSSYAVAQCAKLLGKQDDYERLMEYSKGWELLFDPKSKFILPKDKNGTFKEDLDPFKPWDGFQEGNAFQYTFYVPHDPAGLIAKVGQDEFNDRLNAVFEKAQETVFGGGRTVNAFSGITSVYNHGNQPCLHIPWLFNFSGQPWLTQKWTRTICNEFYGTTGLHGYGYGQDEDQGQLGAWYVIAALGLFDVLGGARAEPTVQIGSPLFDRVTITLNPDYHPGQRFVIETHNNGPDNLYVQQAQLNGQKLTDCWFDFETLVKGGTLSLTMGSEPNRQWGIADPPPCN